MKKGIIIVVGNIGIIIRIISIAIIGFLVLFYNAFFKVHTNVHKDISEYDNRKNIGFHYLYDPDILSHSITTNMQVQDYQMVYADRWNSSQFVTYLVVNYNEEDYQNEVTRLQKLNLNSDKYIGTFSVIGFTKYELLAINYSDEYGFIYAITDNKNQIIYAELTFSEFGYEIDYKKYINNDYLPDGLKINKKAS